MEYDLQELKRTAYALGELEAAERAGIEAELASSPAKRTEAGDARVTARAITAALATERSPGLSELHHLAIESRLQQLTASADSGRRRTLRDKLMFWVPTALAACAMIASGVTFMLYTQQVQDNAEARRAAQIGGDGASASAGGKSGTGGTGARIGDGNRNARPRTDDIVRAIHQHNVDHPPVGTPTYRGQHLDTLNLTDADAGQAFRPVALTPLATFPLTVDVASYEFVQRYLERGALPPVRDVHVEAIINAHRYDDAPHPTGDQALAVKTEVSDCPWNKEHRLARVLIRARGEGDGTPASGVAAEDTRVRVEFNPAKVAGYRLIGYENRWQVEGPNPAEAPVELYNGHTLTVLYEIVPTGSAAAFDALEASGGRLKYQKPAQLTHSANTEELFTVALRYRTPEDPLMKVAEASAVDSGTTLAQASPQFRLAAAAAQFGLLLIDSPAKGKASYDAAFALAVTAVDEEDVRQMAMLELIRKARAAVN